MDIETALGLLSRESEELDGLVSALAPAQWATPTPSASWTIADGIAHLHWTDLVTAQAITGDPAFADTAARVDDTTVDTAAHRLADQPPQHLLAAWRQGRIRLRTAIAAADPAEPVPWFGPSMRPMTMTTARIMETWAHGLDVWDALEEVKPATETLAAVARIGARTRDYAFASHGRPVPETEVRVELSMPDGPALVFGDETAENRVTGSAWGFAAVVTQRRHPADVDLSADGPIAAEWLELAQAFAGAPTLGPAAGERTVGGRR